MNLWEILYKFSFFDYFLYHTMPKLFNTNNSNLIENMQKNSEREDIRKSDQKGKKKQGKIP